MRAGMVFGGTNAAAGVFLNIIREHAAKILMHFITFLECIQGSSMRFLKEYPEPLYQH